MRIGLFQDLFIRVMALIALSLAMMIGLSLFHENRYIEQMWRADLQHEAEWLAYPVDLSAVVAQNDAQESARAARSWRARRESVRLVVRDDAGNTVLDSHAPDASIPGAEDGRLLVGRTTMERMTGESYEFILSRPRPAPLALGSIVELVVGALAITLVAALLLYPLTRDLTHAFGALGHRASRLAAGETGPPLERMGGAELQALIGAFNAMARRLHEGETRRRRLVSDISHELRSPMARLRALTETLVRHPEETLPLAKQMESEIHLVDRLVGDLLDVARLEEGRGGVVKQELAVESWFHEATQRLRARVERAGAVFETDTAGAGAIAAFDPERLVQALGNLVDNALAAVSGQPSAKVTVNLGVSAQTWSLSVRDNGRGIPKAALGEVFERFYRVDDDRGRDRGGTGLGLCIAKAIVEAHGGVISIDSELGQGAEIEMTFPLSEAETAKRRA